MFNEQHGKCAICDKDMEMPTSTRGQGLDVVAVDHCHITGNTRKLLCNACNKGIGLLKDDIMILKKAIEYLKEYDEQKKISDNKES